MKGKRDGDALRYIITLADSFPNKSLTVSCSRIDPHHVARRRYIYTYHIDKSATDSEGSTMHSWLVSASSWIRNGDPG